MTGERLSRRRHGVARFFIRCDPCGIFSDLTGDATCPLCGSKDAVPISLDVDRHAAMVTRNLAMASGQLFSVAAAYGTEVGVWYSHSTPSEAPEA